MMTIHLTHADYDAAHLAAVSEEMRTLGAPTIRAIRGDVNVWYALEGCHRLRAAHALGLIPTIEEVEYSDTVMASDLGLDWQDDAPIGTVTDGLPAATLVWRD